MGNAKIDACDGCNMVETAVVAIQEGDMGFSALGTKCRPLSPEGVAQVQRLVNLPQGARPCPYRFIPKKVDDKKVRVGQQKQKTHAK